MSDPESSSFDLREIQRFTTGTIGPKGQRVFYVQAVGEGSVVSLRLEKQQVHGLAEYLAGMLEDLPTPPAPEIPDELDLVEPVVAEWVVGDMGVAYAESDDRIILWIEERTAPSDEHDEPEVDAASARFRISRAQAHAFIERAREVVASGRPPCPYCGRALDHEDGWCVCSN